jgi:tetrahydromethanopterin S-methyltransferase subunit E
MQAFTRQSNKYGQTSMNYILEDTIALLTNPFLLVPILVAVYFCKSYRQAAIYGAFAGIAYLAIWFGLLLKHAPAHQSVVLAILIGIVLTPALAFIKFKRQANK